MPFDSCLYPEAHPNILQRQKGQPQKENRVEINDLGMGINSHSKVVFVMQDKRGKFLFIENIFLLKLFAFSLPPLRERKINRF